MKLIGAVSINGVVGNGGVLAWEFKDELSFFRSVTLYETCIKGKNTVCELKDRDVLTMGEDLFNPHEAPKDSIIIGGPNTWAQFLQEGLIKEAYVTLIHDWYEGDCKYDLYYEVNKRLPLVPILDKGRFTVLYGRV
jgi:dihydrofolate reductase